MNTLNLHASCKIQVSFEAKALSSYLTCFHHYGSSQGRTFYLKSILNPIVSNINILGFKMKTIVLTKMDDILTVIVDQVLLFFKHYSCRNCFISKISLHALVAMMYSTFVVDSATYFCRFNYQETTTPTNVTNYPEVDFLGSKSPVISVSVSPFNTSSVSLKYKQTFGAY